MLRGRVLRLEKLNLTKQLGRRIRFCCVHANGTLVVFGASTGTVYFYNRQDKYDEKDPDSSGGLAFMRLASLYPDRKTGGSIVQVKINPCCPDLIAVCTADFIIHVLYVPLATQAPERVIFRFRIHTSLITQLQWDLEGRHLYSSDSSGLVMVTPDACGGEIDSRTGTFLPSKTAPKLISREIYRGESAIVQIDVSNELVLVSSHNKSVLLDLKRNYVVIKIGSKDRHGSFGACFDPQSNGSQVLCALPREKMWLADGGGNVLATLKLHPTTCAQFDPYSTKVKQKAKFPANLSQLVPFHRGLLSWGPGQPILLVDPVAIEVVEWFGHEAFSYVHCVAAGISELYVMSAESEAATEALNVHVVKAVPPGELFQHVIKQLKKTLASARTTAATEETKTKAEQHRIDLIQHISTCSLRASQFFDNDQIIQDLKQTASTLSEALSNDLSRALSPPAATNSTSSSPDPNLIDWTPATNQLIQHFSDLLHRVLQNGEQPRSLPINIPGSAPSSPSLAPSTTAANASPPDFALNDTSRKLTSLTPPTSSPLTSKQVPPASNRGLLGTTSSTLAHKVSTLAERSLLRAGQKEDAGAGLAKAVAVLKSFTGVDESKGKPPLADGGSRQREFDGSVRPERKESDPGYGLVSGAPAILTPLTGTIPFPAPVFVCAPNAQTERLKKKAKVVPIGPENVLSVLSAPPRKKKARPKKVRKPPSTTVLTITPENVNHSHTLASTAPPSPIFSTTLQPVLEKEPLSSASASSATSIVSSPPKKDIAEDWTLEDSSILPYMTIMTNVQQAHDLACSTSSLSDVLSSWFAEFESLIVEGPTVFYEALTVSSSPLMIELLSQIRDLLTAYLSLQLSVKRFGALEKFLQKYSLFLDLNKIFEICITSHVCERCCSRVGKAYCPTIFTADTLSQDISVHIDLGTIDSVLTLIGRHAALVFHFLPNLIQTHPKKAVLTAASLFPLIAPWMVRGVLLSREAVCDKAIDDPSHGQNLYLDYLLELLQRNDCRANSFIVTECFDLCLFVDQPKDILRTASTHETHWWWQSSVNMVPVVGSQNVKWKHQDLLLDIVNNPSIYHYNDFRLAHACAKFGFVKGLEVLYLRSDVAEVTKAALLLAMAIQDVDFLLVLMDKRMSPFSGDPKNTPMKFEHWKTLLVGCRSESSGINFWFVVRHMVTLLGSYLALCVMLKSGVLHQEQLPASLHGEFLVSWELQEKRRSLGLQILETIDTHLWQPSSSTLATYFQATLKHEQNVRRFSRPQWSMDRSISFEDVISALSIEADSYLTDQRPNNGVIENTLSSLKTPHEQGSNHWGVHINLTPNVVCACCGMRIKICEDTSAVDALRDLCLDDDDGTAPKGEQDAWDGSQARPNKQKEDDGFVVSPDDTPYQTADHNKLGATAFRCGHVFHRSCLSEQACALCFDSSYAC